MSFDNLDSSNRPPGAPDGTFTAADDDQRYRLIAESTRDLILVLDRTGVIVWASPSHLHVLGRAIASVVGHHVGEFLHPDDRERQRQVFAQRVESRGARRAEFRVQHMNGTYIPFESLGVPVLDARGETDSVIISARDITDRKAAEHRLQQIVQVLPAIVWTTDRDLNITSSDGAALPTTGIARGEMLGKSLRTVLEGDPVLQRALEAHEKVLAGASFSFETQWRGRDLLVTMEPLRDESGGLTGVVGIALDTTDQKIAERRYRTLFERNVAGVFRSTVSGRMLECNQAFARIFGYESPDEVLTAPAFDLYFTREDREALLNLLRTRGEAVNFESRLRRQDGTAVWVLMHERLVPNDDGEDTLEGTVVDITAKKLAEERIEYQAFHDSLTGLPNRFLFNDRLTHALAQARRHQRSAAVLFLDVDHFKIINDTMSHNAGDELLKAVAARLSAAIRVEDTVARIGGDEFVFIISELATGDAVASAAKVAEKVLETLRGHFMINGREIFISGSVGIAISPADGEDLDSLVKNADSAMYRAKELGRNGYQFHTPHSQRRAEVRLTLESGLRRALERDEFFLMYQPQVSLRTGKINGFEALLRWNRPSLGIVPPKDFIPLAEEIGLIVPIGEWVLWTASRQMRAWHLVGYPHLRLAVNLSPRQFQHDGLAAMVQRVLTETEMPADRLELEITETLSIHDSDLTFGRLTHFRSMGMSAALDDFGTGYSSLSHLRVLPIDTVKIDRSFIAEMTPGRPELAIVQAVITMAHSLHLRVVAEGVETEAQRNTLTDLGCDDMQGYIFSRPLHAVEAESLLREERLRG